MGGLEEVSENRQTDEGDGARHEDEGDITRRNTTRRKLLRIRRNSGGSERSVQISPSGQTGGRGGGQEEGERQNARRQAATRGQGMAPVQKDLQTQFYKEYRKVAEEYDKEFIKIYDDDLNTTLIFAGLFSAVASAFIIEVNSELQPDPNDQTAALLRVLIYKIDNTTFGNDVPTPPQWAGPPRSIVEVQAILFASLAASLFSAFLAMHGKQWLNRYDSTDVRETVIERGQSRQRKLDGAIAWYFHYVMESLPLMLQTSLLLLGCALSRYLWEVNITVASVVLGITSFAVILYLLIVIAGAAFESCPYKTPGASVFRPVALYVRYRVLPTLHPAFISSRLLHVTRGSYCRALLVDWWGDFQLPWYSIRNIINPFFLLLMPIHLVADARLLGRGTLRWLVCFGGCVYRQWQLAFSWTRWLLASFGKNTYRWFTRIPQAHGLDQHAITLDLQCVSWILRTSLNKLVHLATFEHLAAMPELTRFDPALVVGCFNIFINCVSVTNDRVVTTRGFEELAAASARCFLRTFLHLSVTDPTSSTLVDLRKRYNTIFPFSTDFTGLPFCSTMTTIHLLFYRRMHFPSWNNNIWLTQERVPFSRDVVETAWAECQRMQRVKVPRRFLHFVIYSLSMDSLPSAPVVANCLIVIAIDLGCYLWHVPTLDESLQTERVSSLITQKLEAMAKAADQDLIHSKRKVISALFIYLILERGRQQQMANAISRAVQVSGDRWLTWEHIKPYTPMLFRGPNTPSMDSLIVLLSPYIDWDDTLHNKDDVIRWVAAVSAVPYTEEVGRDVVGALPRIASCDSLRPYIPIEFWTWLKTHSTPPSRHPRPRIGITDDAVHYVRGLGDIDIFKSYLLLAFSEHNPVHNGFRIGYSLGEDFGGIGMWGHRKDLIERLDRVLEGCDHVDDDFEKERRVAGYDLLRRVFLQIEKEAVTTLIQSHSTFGCALPLPCP